MKPPEEFLAIENRDREILDLRIANTLMRAGVRLIAICAEPGLVAGLRFLWGLTLEQA